MTQSRRVSPRIARVAPFLAVLLAFGSVLTGCSDSDSDSGVGGEQPVSTGAEFDVLPTEVVLGKVIGEVSNKERARLTRKVGKLVDTWWEPAYLQGDWPKDFADAEGADDPFRRFARGARTDALSDLDLLTNNDLGASIQSVEQLTRRVTVAIVSPEGEPIGATAKFLLKFQTHGETSAIISVRGALALVPKTAKAADPQRNQKKSQKRSQQRSAKIKWRVLAYDVRKGRR